MYRVLFTLIALAGIAGADTITFTISGTGTGAWGSQTFTNAAFTFTFTSETNSILEGTPCCAGAITTPSGTAGAVSVASLGNGTISGGDQAIFVNQSESTAGIWHYNSPDFLTIGNAAFSTYDLTTNIGPLGGTTFSFATPISATPFGGLYFTSVSGVTFTAQRAQGGGTPAAVSANPSSGTQAPQTPVTFTFAASDTADVGDLQGIDILFANHAAPGSPQGPDPYACWMFYQVSTNTLTIYYQGNWTYSGPIGGAGQNGPNLGGDECVVNTSSATLSASGNLLALSLPITFKSSDNTPDNWSISMLVANNESVNTGYQQVGTMTLNPSSGAGFSLSIAPTTAQGVAIGAGSRGVNYTLTVAPYGGFNDTVTFSADESASGGNGELAAAFNPPTLTGSGSTTMTVSTTSESVSRQSFVRVLANSPSYSDSINTAPIYVANGPPALSVFPYPGNTLSQTFTVTATDPAAGAEVNSADILFAPTLNGQHACWISYSPANGFWLASDDASTWLFIGFPGATTSASNSQCTVTAGSASTASGSITPNPTLTLGLPVTFNSAFAGTQTIFLSGSNLAGFESGYKASGTWNVP